MDASHSATERAFQHVRARVLDQTYSPGSLLTEGEIATAVGVSRTPVREALLRLEAQGLLRLYPKRGALVLPVSAGEMDDVFEARELVEGFAARKAWKLRETVLPQLDELLAAMTTAQARGDAVALSGADRDFHAAIVRAAGNQVLIRLYDGLRDRQTSMGIAAAGLSPKWMERAVSEHTAIVAALRSGTAASLRSLVQEHVAGARAHLRADR